MRTREPATMATDEVVKQPRAEETNDFGVLAQAMGKRRGGFEASVQDGLSAPTHELPGRARFESSLGTDLGHVRAHAGPQAAAACDALGAEAFTVGNDIVLGSPDLDLAVVGHEVAHTFQQRDGRVHCKAEGQTDALEVQADNAGAAMAAGQRVSPGALSRGASGVQLKHKHKHSHKHKDTHKDTGKDAGHEDEGGKAGGDEGKVEMSPSGQPMMHTPYGRLPHPLRDIAKELDSAYGMKVPADYAHLDYIITAITGVLRAEPAAREKLKAVEGFVGAPEREAEKYERDDATVTTYVQGHAGGDEASDRAQDMKIVEILVKFMRSHLKGLRAMLGVAKGQVSNTLTLLNHFQNKQSLDNARRKAAEREKMMDGIIDLVGNGIEAAVDIATEEPAGLIKVVYDVTTTIGKMTQDDDLGAVEEKDDAEDVRNAQASWAEANETLQTVSDVMSDATSLASEVEGKDFSFAQQRAEDTYDDNTTGNFSFSGLSAQIKKFQGALPLAAEAVEACSGLVTAMSYSVAAFDGDGIGWLRQRQLGPWQEIIEGHGTAQNMAGVYQYSLLPTALDYQTRLKTLVDKLNHVRAVADEALVTKPIEKKHKK